MDDSNYLRDLHASLDGRLRPEDVLVLISRGDPSSLPRSLRGTVWSPYSYWSSMSTDFERPVGGAAQLASAEKAFQHSLKDVDPDNPQSLSVVVDDLSAEIGCNGRRLTSNERQLAGVELSRRKYNRQWRAMRRLYYKSRKLTFEQRKRELLIIGRSGFVSCITLEDFVRDPHAAHFITYWVARKNLRRQFSLSGKTNPMDEIASYLLKRCEDNPHTDWFMIAKARPTPDVLSKLTDVQKGDLLAQWYAVLREYTNILKNVWSSDVNKSKMIVRRGHDSSTWNTVAQAYNTARASWLSCVVSLGAERLLDASCPGKVMRLMAADLVYWHSMSGGDVDPNTEVWSLLPMPWDVLDGTSVCTRSDVITACMSANVDPRDSGWLAPKPPGIPVSFEMTPELVHGVTVADPAWALLLRRAGVFSGKKITNDEDLRDAVAYGLSRGVVTSDLPVRGLEDSGSPG